ncbi:fructose-bisphosphate aldolase class II [Salsuginibacillus halophilus]|uniref:Fructose-bisphosphate aldolase class II n=1 Tax=Salsuginibacillus halophilus TaxID=517424 RepID=A0A2P8HL32_9BACI|nr:class II fructose-bisphosphate aldolase [Salsuginibacillus halophilus]PSL46890.1 fructose-bisphosphate aldolase class II [Salsuginibacillus halophilus]
MPFVSGKDLLNHAFENGYGVGAFSAHNAETVQGIIQAAEEEQAPIMIQVGQKVINTLGMKPMKQLIEYYAREATIPIAIHLDHSRQFEQTMEAVQLGFQSVMYDGSAKSFEENAGTTADVVKIAKALGIGAEGEIGKIGGTEDDITVDEKDAMITSTEEAVAFVEATGIDYIAVSIGTAHGIYQKPPELQFDRIEEIAKAVKRPVVMHGGSDVPDEDVRRAISLGIAKINVDTELRAAFTQGVQAFYEASPDNYVLADSLGRGREEMVKKVKEKIHVFYSNGKAPLVLNDLNRDLETVKGEV